MWDIQRKGSRVFCPLTGPIKLLFHVYHVKKTSEQFLFFLNIRKFVNRAFISELLNCSELPLNERVCHKCLFYRKYQIVSSTSVREIFCVLDSDLQRQYAYQKLEPIQMVKIVCLSFSYLSLTPSTHSKT